MEQKTINDQARAKGKAYSQNSVLLNPICFKPTSKQISFLEAQDKSKVIKEALDLLILKRTNLDKLLEDLNKNYPLNWRRINRRHGKRTTNKIRELKNGRNN